MKIVNFLLDTKFCFIFFFLPVTDETLLLNSWILPAFSPPTFFYIIIKEWDIFLKLLSYVSLNREHNTGGDEAGGCFEKEIAFFWHS